MSLLAGLASQVPVPVFALIGDGGSEHVRPLLADSRLHLAESPRHATILVVLGGVPDALLEAARQVHDQVSAPRATVVLDADALSRLAIPAAQLVRAPAKLAEVVVDTHRSLMSGALPSEGRVGPEENPIAWQGVGPHGQGGKGMMGGKPYGRAMAMTGEDGRDGLMLDRVEVPLGPFLRWLPPGISVDLTLQGDVVQQARLHAAPFAQRNQAEVFQRALHEEVSVSELELERARHHLFATADLLLLHGLDAQATRILRLALELRFEHEGKILRFARWMRWTGAVRWGTRDVGILGPEQVKPWMGPVARAAGVEVDARHDDPAYEGLGFAAVTHERGDSEARFRQRLAEAVQALALARKAGDRVRRPGPELEGPRGVTDDESGQHFRELVERSAEGQSFDAFATTLVSLDLDAAILPPGRRDESNAEENGQGGEENHH